MGVVVHLIVSIWAFLYQNCFPVWLLAVMIVLLIALGVVMLMSQGQLSLRSVRQEHHAIQDKINQWPPMLYNRGYVDEK